MMCVSKILTLLLIVLLLLACATTAQSQISIDYLDVSLVRHDVLAARVFVQNLGHSVQIASGCGSPFPSLSLACEFRIRYEYIPLGKTIEKQASSITLRTILDTRVAMESPFYELTPTGTDWGEEWEVVFLDIPNSAGRVVVDILGKTYVFGDMPGAEAARKEAEAKRKERVRRAQACVKNGHVALEQTNYRGAINAFENAMQLNQNLADSLSPYLARSYDMLGNNQFKARKFAAAIGSYSQAQHYDMSRSNNYVTKLGSSNYELASSHLSVKDYSKASIYFRRAVEIDSSLYGDVNRQFDKIRVNPIGIAALSLLPGGGQLKNRQYGKAALHFGFFAVFTISSLSHLSNADQLYDKYQQATNAASAVKLYSETQDAWHKCLGMGAGAIAVLAWSVLDSYKTSKSFNKQFTLADHSGASASMMPFYLKDAWGFALCVRF